MSSVMASSCQGAWPARIRTGTLTRRRGQERRSFSGGRPSRPFRRGASNSMATCVPWSVQAARTMRPGISGKPSGSQASNGKAAHTMLPGECAQLDSTSAPPREISRVLRTSSVCRNGPGQRRRMGMASATRGRRRLSMAALASRLSAMLTKLYPRARCPSYRVLFSPLPLFAPLFDCSFDPVVLACQHHGDDPQAPR